MLTDRTTACGELEANCSRCARFDFVESDPHRSLRRDPLRGTKQSRRSRRGPLLRHADHAGDWELRLRDDLPHAESKRAVVLGRHSSALRCCGEFVPPRRMSAHRVADTQERMTTAIKRRSREIREARSARAAWLISPRCNFCAVGD